MKKNNGYFLMALSIFFLNIGACQSENKVESDKMKKTKIVKMIKDFPRKLRSAPTLNSLAAHKISSESKVIFVDVRKNKEMKISMIDGAISEDTFESNMEKYRNYTIIPYCTIGYRSAKYTLKLAKKGFKAFNLEGGVLLWTFAGYDVYDKNSKIIFDVHVYGKDWNLLPSTHKAIW